ncbi:hypothetical protein [Noviherbaspirillum aridicola]|uniref:Uncharacterized protein n=1 Tax=Noviherbaspirillum aridicola TaxID=2849687 RepID=A0ABQ4Q3D3_9BURK|nr:hypothetical protein [Noviherbaspirillum aridicola]GIZ51702.1 hypothetical protein NCCP691_17160 [Noviherbaspirillum aridicola]
MATGSDTPGGPGNGNGKDALDNALARERVAREEVPVKQHNPDDKGLNPGQKGPAQPSGSDAPGAL